MRGARTAPSLGGGSVVLHLPAVLWAAPTAWAARRRLRCVHLICRGWPPGVHWSGSPVVPAGAVPTCRPCYHGGSPVTGRRWWPPVHRASSPDNGVDALSEVHAATPGVAARYGLRGCARRCRRARQGTRCSGLPGVPTPWVPSLKLPGRAARSRGRTFTGEFQCIHGMLSGTFAYACRSLRIRGTPSYFRSVRDLPVPGTDPYMARGKDAIRV